ncbi:NACHT domain-containing protein [Klebsiella aerogenes]
MVGPFTANIIQAAVVKSVELMLQKIFNSQWPRDCEDAKEIVHELQNGWPKNKFIEKHVQHTLKMRTLINPNDDVTLTDIYHPLTVVTASNGDSISIKDDFILQFSGIANIIGIAGQGKSTILRKLFLEEIKKAERVPFFIELRNVPDGNILAYFKNLLKSLHITVTDSNVEYLLQSKKIVLLLDGFDEIRQETTVQAIQSIFELNKTYACPLITTSRPNTQICQMPGINNLIVKEIDLEDKLRILNLIDQQDPKSNKTTFRSLCNLLVENTYFEETISNPIMVALLYHCFPYMDEVPKDVTDFYRQLFGVLYARHDKTKGYNNRERESRIEVEPARTLFSNLCLKSLLKEQYYLDSHTLHQHIKNALKSHGYDEKLADAFTNDIVKITCLLQADGNDRFVYLHKSVQEFFAAFFISTLQEKTIKSQIYAYLRKSLLSSPKFDNLLQFLYYLDNLTFLNEITLETFKCTEFEKYANLTYEEISVPFDKLLSDGGVYGESTLNDTFVTLTGYTSIGSILKLDFLNVIKGDKRDNFDIDLEFRKKTPDAIDKENLSSYSYNKTSSDQNKNRFIEERTDDNPRENYKFNLKKFLIINGLYEYYKKVFFETIVDFNNEVYKVKQNEVREMKDAMVDSFGFISEI